MRLENEWHRIEIDLVHGGRADSWHLLGQEILAHAGTAPVEWGMYPMAPWAGRLRDNRYLDQVMPATHQQWAIHGVVLDRPWMCVASGDAFLETMCAAEVAGVAIECRVRWVLDGPELTTVMSLHSSVPIPAVLGWHPWFRRDVAGAMATWSIGNDARLLVRDADYLPTAEERSFTTVSGPFDDVFRVPSGTATITWGSVQLTMHNSQPWFVIYDERPDALCIEPQTDAPNATSGPCATAGAGAPVVMTTTWHGAKLSENP